MTTANEQELKLFQIRYLDARMATVWALDADDAERCLMEGGCGGGSSISRPAREILTIEQIDGTAEVPQEGENQ